MKIIKLMLAVSLAVVPVMSVFMESATAQRNTTGNTYDQMGQDESPQKTSVYVQFNLFDADRNGNPILDLESENDNLGVFFGAIENYRTGFGRLLEQDESLVRNSSGFPIYESPFNVEKELFDVGNLRAELISQGGSEVIEYSIFELGKDDPVLQINTLRDLDRLDKKRAVNDLSYILNDNLLELTTATPNSPKVSSVINFAPIYRTGVINQIPEPNTTASLLVLGFFGASSLLKRKVKRS